MLRYMKSNDDLEQHIIFIRKRNKLITTYSAQKILSIEFLSKSIYKARNNFLKKSSK